MGCVAIKFNFFAHTIAQGKKQEPHAPDINPAPSTNIQKAVIQTYSGKGKEVVRGRVSLLCDAPDAPRGFVLDLRSLGS